MKNEITTELLEQRLAESFRQLCEEIGEEKLTEILISKGCTKKEE